MNYDNSKVRRQDRLLSAERALELLQSAEYGILSMVSQTGGGYGIPLNFVLLGDALYFHCAPEGEKLRALHNNDNVSFVVVGRTRPIPNKFTTLYESVIAQGTIRLGLSDEERMHALHLLLEKYSPNDQTVGRKYAEKSFHRTEVMRMDIQTVSGKSKAGF